MKIYAFYTLNTKESDFLQAILNTLFIIHNITEREILIITINYNHSFSDRFKWYWLQMYAKYTFQIEGYKYMALSQIIKTKRDKLYKNKVTLL